ncbi:MAG: flagellar biosynthetic protein FliO [candidate division KSB1 bacterium]|nr:flagellar biosynthetic protein FliO [candidate division KSB1 bacterium]
MTHPYLGAMFTIYFMITMINLPSACASYQPWVTGEKQGHSVTDSSEGVILWEEPQTYPVKATSLTSVLIRALVSIVGIGILIYLTVFLLKKFVYNRGANEVGTGLMRIIGTTYLGPKKALYLVKALDRILILGVTDAQITTLCEIKDEALMESVETSLKTSRVISGKPFSEYLSSWFKKSNP